MPTILRLCLYALGSEGAGGRTQLWLSFSVDHTTTPKTIIHSARMMVEERMTAHLEAPEGQMALCVRDAKDNFIFVGTAKMAAAEVRIVRMPFFVQFLHTVQCQLQEQRRQQSESMWNKFVFLQGALLPLMELWRMNNVDTAGDSPSVSLYAVVKIPAALGCEPVDTAGLEKDSLGVCVYYVDFSGKQYVATVQKGTGEAKTPTTTRLCEIMRAACDSIGAQKNSVFDASKMVLMCRLGTGVAHPIETDTALRIALAESSAHLFLYDRVELPAAPSPPRAVSQERPQLMLREDEAVEMERESKRDEDKDEGTQLFRNHEDDTVSSGVYNINPINNITDVKVPIDVGLASSTAKTCQLASVDSALSFMPCDRDSIPRLQTCDPAASANAEAEREAARLRLAASHARLDEAYHQYRAETERSGKHDREMDELRRRKAVLSEEWSECLSAERDCERLETLIEWLEKDLAEGHTRQEQLIRAIYGS